MDERISKRITELEEGHIRLLGVIRSQRDDIKRLTKERDEVIDEAQQVYRKVMEAVTKALKRGE